MPSASNQITAVDYNTIRDKVVSILGTGSATRGYGQALQSSPVLPGNAITKAQWDALRYDIINIKVHQDGATPTIASVPANEPIRFGAGNPNTNFNTLIEQAILNRFALGGGQSVLSSKALTTHTTSWSTQASAELTVTFANATECRYFFNSGSKIRISALRTGGVTSSQNNAWSNVLTAAGVQSFGAAVPDNNNFYTLTNSYADTIYYYKSASTPYSSNYYELAAKCNVADNSLGTATEVKIRILLRDDYVDIGPPAPGDLVNGTLTFTVDEIKAAGVLLPSGNFTISSPTYSLSSITAS
jgi:hypothetical protein